MKKYQNLLGKYVKFSVGMRRLHYGRVSSQEQEIVNIRGIEQRGTTRPQYHFNIQEIRECTHDEVFKLGRSARNLFK